MLSQGRTTLRADLTAIYLDVEVQKSAAIMARRMADAVYQYARSGIPMAQIVFPAPVILPSVGFGLGGLDVPTPGVGLITSLPLFISDLSVAYSHSAGGSADLFASRIASAIHGYYSKALVLTVDNAPGPAGPTTGIGGLLTITGGTGLSAALPTLAAQLTAIYSKTQSSRNRKICATEIATAIHSFCIQAKVRTLGAMTSATTARGTTGQIL